MSGSANVIQYIYKDFWNANGDPRVQHLPMMGGGPWPVISMVVAYLYFVKILGPSLMKDRKPYELKWIIRLYNLGMVMWNLWGFMVANKMVNYGLDTWKCRPIDPKDNSPQQMHRIGLGWVFLVSRLVEFADTIFFVLRKKYSQVSGFHVFHHSSVPIAVWFYLKFVPGDNAAFFPYINTAIHVVMYSYYFLATFGPVMAPYLWWKKYLTQMQIVQFLLLICHNFYLAVLPAKCFPRPFLANNFLFAIIFLYLFTNFYLKNYSKSSNSSSSSSSSKSKSIDNGSTYSTAASTNNNTQVTSHEQHAKQN